MIFMLVKGHMKMIRMIRIFARNMTLPPIWPATEHQMTSFVYRKKMGNLYWVNSLFADCPENHDLVGQPDGWDFTDVSDEKLLNGGASE